MSLLTSNDALYSDESDTRRASRQQSTDKRTGVNRWKVAGLLISTALIVVSLYYAEANDIILRRLYRSLFIFPIVLAAYHFGTTGGVSSALLCTAVFFPILIRYTSQFGLSGETLEVLTIVILLNLLAFIIANLADFQRKQEQFRLILNQIGSLFEMGLDAQQLSAAVLNSGMEICRAEFGEVILRDEATGKVQIVAHKGFHPTDQDFGGHSAARGTRLIDWLVAHNQPLLVNHIDQDPRFERRPSGPLIRSLLAVPLRQSSTAAGCVVLMSRRAVHFTSEDLATLAAIVEKSERGIENARLYERTDENLRRRLAELASLAQLGIALSETLDLDQALKTAVAYATRLLEVPICDIHLIEGDHLNPGVAADRRNGAPTRAPIKIEGPLKRIIEHAQPLVAADLKSDPVLPAEWQARALGEGARAYLGVPLVSQGSSIGMLSIYHKQPHEWLAHEINFAAAVANAVASAIANAQLFEAVSERKRWTELVLCGIADGVMTADQECRIQIFNPAAERITGWSAGQAIGRSWCEVFQFQDQATRRPTDCTRCPHRQALSEAASDFQTYKSSFTRPDGTELTLASTTAPLHNQLGEAVGTVTIFRDVSKEERLNRMKSDFISIVSHELRAPLANIMASVDLLSRAQLEPQDQQEVVDILHSQSRRLNRFVEDILSVSRIDAEEIRIQLRPVAVRPLLQRTINALQAKTVRHTFKVHVQENLPYALADEGKLEIILQNLLRNALQYSHQESTITVDAHQDNGHVVISISDEGPGISPEHQKHIFERFYRADTTDSRPVYGHGLGLYICKKLVEAQGGQIWVESQAGIGTQFSFALRPFDVEE